MMQPLFRLGCAIWAHKPWVGTLYPPGSHPREFLRLYSRRFSTVEGNTTFYSVPDRGTVQRWVAETPAGFEFCLKLPRSLTHSGSLRASVSGTLRFLEQIQDLDDRRGPLFAQLPPTYSPAFLDDLTAFLTAFPRHQVPLALEVRHPAWFQAPHRHHLSDLLMELGVGRVLLDSRPVYDVGDDPQCASDRKKPNLPLQPEVTTDFALVRYISNPDCAVNTPYFQMWATQITQWLQQGIRTYVFIHCPLEARSPHNAFAFQTCLQQQGVPVPPPPEAAIAPTHTQLSLFSE